MKVLEDAVVVEAGDFLVLVQTCPHDVTENVNTIAIVLLLQLHIRVAKEPYPSTRRLPSQQQPPHRQRSLLRYLELVQQERSPTMVFQSIVGQMPFVVVGTGLMHPVRQGEESRWVEYAPRWARRRSLRVCHCHLLLSASLLQSLKSHRRGSGCDVFQA